MYSLFFQQLTGMLREMGVQCDCRNCRGSVVWMLKLCHWNETLLLSFLFISIFLAGSGRSYLIFLWRSGENFTDRFHFSIRGTFRKYLSPPKRQHIPWKREESTGHPQCWSGSGRLWRQHIEGPQDGHRRHSRCWEEDNCVRQVWELRRGCPDSLQWTKMPISFPFR